MSPADDKSRVTRLLAHIADGDRQATDELFPIVYAELRRLARVKMARERPGHTLTPTALVNETYLRLVGDTGAGWDTRGHFFASAAEAMRRILIERARRKQSDKRGGGQRRTSLDEGLAVSDEPSPDLLAIDEALTRLEARDETMSRVVKLRYFAGLTVEEVAAALDTSPRTVNRLWKAAKAWLYREMTAR
jgi:RNA polymerase sigma factor (TIGR02999 family)